MAGRRETLTPQALAQELRDGGAGARGKAAAWANRPASSGNRGWRDAGGGGGGRRELPPPSAAALEDALDSSSRALLHLAGS